MYMYTMSSKFVQVCTIDRIDGIDRIDRIDRINRIDSKPAS